MSKKLIDIDYDFNKNKIINIKLNPLSTVNRLGLILTINDDGYTSWDIDLKKLFIWTGTSWKSSSADNYIDINKYIVREKPSGIINGINNIFLLNGTSILGKEMVFVNGLLMDEGVLNDYAINGNILTFMPGAIPITNDKILITYLTL